MHELSIAHSLIELGIAAAEEAGADRVISVQLRLGQLSGVVKDALLFSFDVAVTGTLLEGARLDIEEIPIVVFCERCGVERTLSSPQLLACPVCGSSATVVRQGRELELTSIEIIEREPVDATAHC